MTRYRVIANPIAGKGAGEELIPQVERLLTELGLDFDLVRTERVWHAAELAQEAAAAGYDVVVAMGGDGTSNEVLNGLMQAKKRVAKLPAMGVICIGTGNDFAYGMGIPTEMEAGCRTLAQDQRRTIDVGRVVGGRYLEGRYFGNGIGIGFDTVVGFEAAKMTHLHGFLCYVVAVLKTVFLYFRAPLVTIEYDGHALKQPALMVSVMNGQRMGGGFMMAPDGDPGDGLLDLCIVDQVSRPGIFALVPHFMKGTQATKKPVKTGRSAGVVITAIDGTLPAHADGETLCTDGERLAAEILPGQIDVIYAPPEAAA